MIQSVENNRYTIDEYGFITLNSRKGEVRCDECKNLIANIGNDVLLIRSSITLYDWVNQEIVMRCGKCRHYNRLKIENCLTKEGE